MISRRIVLPGTRGNRRRLTNEARDRHDRNHRYPAAPMRNMMLMMEMRGEMKAMGDIMLKHAKRMQGTSSSPK